MKAVVAAFNQEEAIVGAFSVIYGASFEALLFRAVLYRRSGGGVLDAGAGGAVRGERAGGVAEGGVLLLPGPGLGQPLPGVLRNITHSPSQHLTFWIIITSACSSLSKGSFKDHC